MLTMRVCTMPRQLPGVTWSTFVTRCGLPLCMMTIPTFSCVATITANTPVGRGGRVCDVPRGETADDLARTWRGRATGYRASADDDEPSREPPALRLQHHQVESIRQCPRLAVTAVPVDDVGPGGKHPRADEANEAAAEIVDAHGGAHRERQGEANRGLPRRGVRNERREPEARHLSGLGHSAHRSGKADPLRIHIGAR